MSIIIADAVIACLHGASAVPTDHHRVMNVAGTDTTIGTTGANGVIAASVGNGASAAMIGIIATIAIGNEKPFRKRKGFFLAITIRHTNGRWNEAKSGFFKHAYAQASPHVLP